MKSLGFRERHIVGLLAPLVTKPELLWVRRSAVSTSRVVLGATIGSPPTSNYTEWRFATKWSGFRAGYYERWDIGDYRDEQYWYLERAYLHLYQFESHTGTEIEYLALHCDPNEDGRAPHAAYKRVPHLHIEAAGFPLSKAHLALNHSVLPSKASLTRVLKWATLMLSDEVLSRVHEVTV